MGKELLDAIVSWRTLVVALLVFGFAPGAVLRLIVLAFHRDDPRRKELLAELHRVPRIERPFWVVEQLEVALFEGIWSRLVRAHARRLLETITATAAHIRQLGLSGRLSECLVREAVRLLPAAHRQRYHQEWLAELHMIPGKAARLLAAASLLLVVPRMAWTLVRLG